MKLSESKLRDKIDFNTFYGRHVDDTTYIMGMDQFGTKLLARLEQSLQRQMHNYIWNKARFQSQK